MYSVVRRGGLAVAALALAMLPGRVFAYQTLAELEAVASARVHAPTLVVALDADGLEPADAQMLGTELQGAIDVWAAEDCAAVRITVAPLDDPAVQVLVRLVDDWAGAGLDPSVPATTDLVLLERPDATLEIVSATILLDASLTWSPHPVVDGSAGRDARSVLVHELGHVLGLAHEPDDPGATMFPAYFGSEQASLSADDREGLCEIYRDAPARAAASPAIEVDGCRSVHECAVGEWCVDARCAPDLRYGDECVRGADCLASLCVDESGAGVCTYLCDSDSECPSGTRCTGVEGDDRRVCARAAAATCSITGGGSDSMPVMLWIVLGLLLTWRRRRNGLRLPLAASALLAIAGCNDPGHEPDAGTASDAGEIDPSEDGGRAPDGGLPFDSGPLDDAGRDAGVDAFLPPECDPGMTRIAACGFCGMESQQCDADGHWQSMSACLGQGECAAGTSEIESTPDCAERQRLCLADCAWSPWEDTMPAGMCDGGTTRLTSTGCAAGELREETCTADCSGWSVTRACANPCGGAPRTSPDWASEVCIPAGTFMRGSTTYTDTQPVAEVSVSAFYIDVYPVTNRRYRECMTAGACPPFASTDTYRSWHYDSDRIDHPVQGIPLETAIDFCTWDGGRRLPTEAEWEKAVRGPSPRMNIFPWDDPDYRCDLINAARCGWSCGVFTCEPSQAPDPYNGLPGSRSYYGTYLQFGGVEEWVSDFYSATYFGDPASRTDPIGPAAGEYLRRGLLRAEIVVGADMTVRHHSTGTRGPWGFRCARTGS